MNIKSIKVEKGVTVSLGQYESARVSFELTAELGPKDNLDECERALVDQLDAFVNEQIEELQDVIKDSSVFKVSPRKPTKRR